jgi:hypothetical protein
LQVLGFVRVFASQQRACLLAWPALSAESNMGSRETPPRRGSARFGPELLEPAGASEMPGMSHGTRLVGPVPTRGFALSYRATALLFGLLALVSIAANVFTSGGDPEVHLVFARNLVGGHPLQFNKGLFTSGETSPLYMVLLAGVMAVSSELTAAIFMKVLGVVSAVGVVTLVWREAQHAFADRAQAAAFSLGLAAAPFFFFQAQLGMENMPFALAVAWSVRRALDPALGTGARMGLAAAAHAAFYWRPEAVFLVAVLYGLALLEPRRNARLLLAYVCCSVALLASWRALEAWSHAPLHGAGAMRAITSRWSSLRVPGTAIYVSKSPLSFLAYAWPLLVGIAACRRHVPRALWIVLFGLVAVPFSLHLLLPNSQFSRYALYWWFPLLLATLRTLPHAPLARVRFTSAGFVINVVLVACAESLLRWRAGSFYNGSFLNLAASLERDIRGEVTDALCAQVDCSSPPFVIAMQEVQLRLILDDRVVMRSLDGIVDSDLKRFVSESGEVDHLGYLEEKQVDMILDFPDYEGKGDLRSLAKIYEATAQGPVQRGCSRFSRVALDWRYPTALLRETLPGCR